ncbi:hypothetical protein RB195_016289 [Necator americanus]|uniref:Trypsin Inhibitor like cysteine rich domain protein n=1 Tax=Necator americanus TaxID=51031 RepID=A0ABR1E923_NECAM
MVQGLGNLGCKPFEEDNRCGNLCELTCADAIGNSKPRRSSCYRPLCVCKAYTYRFNGNCVPIDVCERNNGDWKETRPVPPGDISPIPCKDFPCPKGSTCSEGKKICSTKGNCDFTATECLPDGDTSNYDGSGPVATTEVLGTNQPTSCVDFKCNSDQICSMAIGVPKCVPTRMTCNENEEVNPCGNSCELLCADLTNTIL